MLFSVVAAGNGYGLVQTGGQLIVESAMLTLVLLTRPFASTQGNVINISIHCVRVLSVICLLIFAEEMGVAQSTKTVTAAVLIIVQSVLTIILAIIIAVNAIIICLKRNSRSNQKRDTEKPDPDNDTLTPLGPLNTADAADHKDAKQGVMTSYSTEKLPWEILPSATKGHKRGRSEDERLTRSAAPIAGYGHSRNTSRESNDREATEPELGPYRSQGI